MSANFAKFNFKKLNYGTPHMTVYGAQVNRKWNARDLQAQGACDFCDAKCKRADVKNYGNSIVMQGVALELSPPPS